MKKIIKIIFWGIIIILVSGFSFLLIKNTFVIKNDFPIGIEKTGDVIPSKPTENLEKVSLDKVSLTILDKSYDVSVKEGDTVFGMMNRLKSENNNFDFKYKEYPSLGVYINEINGIKEGNGKYWIYYVNGKEAEIGISKFKVSNGDIINWKLE